MCLIFSVVNFDGDTPTLTLCIHTPTCVYVVIANINNIKSSLSLSFDRNYEQGNIIITNLLLPLGHISNNIDTGRI